MDRNESSMDSALAATKESHSGWILGTHLIGDLYGCRNISCISCPDKTKAILINAARKAGATVIDCKMHHFGKDMGVTGILLLSESHISIHTWPEFEYAAIDIFMCGKAQPSDAMKYIEKQILPKNIILKFIDRGSVNNEK